MGINTKSSFIFGHIINSGNRNLPFNEGSGELNAVCRIGSYSMTDYATEIARAMNAAGTQVYIVVVDRNTRLITISAPLAFDLLFDTGSTAVSSQRDLLGYGATDYTAAITYEAPGQTGQEYLPQFKLQNFVDFIDNIESSDSTVNVSASGVTEVVTFARIEKMECEIMWATDNQVGTCLNSSIEYNPTGIADLRNFMNNMILKGNIEFLPDRTDVNTFTKCFLDRTSKSKDGVNFMLKEMTSKGLQGYFESGKLTFRKVED